MNTELPPLTTDELLTEMIVAVQMWRLEELDPEEVLEVIEKLITENL